MAFILFFLILLFLSGKILCNTGRLRLQYVCTAVILFPYDLVLCNSPQISYMVVISCLFFLSFLRHKEYKRIQIDKRIIFFFTCCLSYTSVSVFLTPAFHCLQVYGKEESDSLKCFILLLSECFPMKKTSTT